MKQHRFLVSPSQLHEDLVTFSTEQWHQMHSVLRLRQGDSVRVFDGNESVDLVVELTGAAEGQVVDKRRQAAEPGTRLVVYPALLQRDTFEPVLQKLTEIGAAVIVPLLTARGVVREAPDDRRQTRWRAILREAAEQCGRGVVPELAGGLRFAQALARATAAGPVLMAYEGEQRRSVRDALVGAVGTVSLVVGPEGGFAPEEVACARDAGARLITLGPRILRSETAAPLLAALVLHELGDLSCADDDA